MKQHNPVKLPALAFLLAVTVALASCGGMHRLRDGDIVFQKSKSRQSAAIAAATHSNHTHVGLVLSDRESGRLFVHEAIQPVTRTPLKEWIARGEQGSYEAKRLTDQRRVDVRRLREEVDAMTGRDYDWLFDWADDRIYCSELVWKAYFRASGVKLAPLRKLRDFDLSSPVVRHTMRERYGSRVPWDMPVVSPAEIHDSALLRSVTGN